MWGIKATFLTRVVKKRKVTRKRLRLQKKLAYSSNKDVCVNINTRSQNFLSNSVNLLLKLAGQVLLFKLACRLCV